MKHSRRRDHRPVAGKNVGLPRYRKDQWERWLEMVDDRELWSDTYEEWQRDAEAMAQRLRITGLNIVWVDLDAHEFLRWCKSRGYPNDAEARNRFAAERIGNIPPPDQSAAL